MTPVVKSIAQPVIRLMDVVCDKASSVVSTQWSENWHFLWNGEMKTSR